MPTSDRPTVRGRSVARMARLDKIRGRPDVVVLDRVDHGQVADGDSDLAKEEPLEDSAADLAPSPSSSLSL